MVAIVYLLHRYQQAIKEHQRRRLKKKIACLLRIKLSSRTRNYLITASLGNSNNCAWQRLYHGPDEGSFIASTSLTRSAFQVLLGEFNKCYVVKSGGGKRGRPPKATYKSTVLGLLLCFYTGTSDSSSLCREFGIPPATLNRLLANGEAALFESLTRLPDAQVRWPSFADQVEWGQLIQLKEPLLKHKFGFVDASGTPDSDPDSAS
ncbi:hypothetical protein BDR26DRAFT_893845 [Obelidium mucronatum]|nr:hypothetical protein BDR26DRAFT_893845 [Obelidium mucronatum]